MGCDGGTIPKRCELVKEKKKKEQKDKDVELMARWLLCALSQLQLRMPIMACELGRLYNKESILEFLLDRSKFAESGDQFSHIRSMKDVHVLKLTEDPSDKQAASSSSSATLSKFICPVSQLELNGKHKFLYPVGCGCVFSERALRELIPTSQKNENDTNKLPCPVCGVSFDYIQDVVVLNPEPGAELDEAKKNMEKRRLLQKSAKKRSADADASKNKAKQPSEEVKKAKIVSSSTSATINGSSKVVIPDSKSTRPEEKSAVYRSLFINNSQDNKSKK